MATANSRRNKNADQDDFYSTRPATTRALLDREQFPGGPIFEPCCGNGRLAKVLEEYGYPVIARDLVDRGYGETGIDYLASEPPAHAHLVTNPPYKLAQQFCEKGLREVPAGGKVAMLLRVNFLETKKRKPFWLTAPLKTLYVFTERQRCDKAGEESEPDGGAVFYCWFVFQRGYIGEAVIKWI